MRLVDIDTVIDHFKALNVHVIDISILENIPAIKNNKIKHAKWIHDAKNDLAPGLWTSYKCSNCGEPVTSSIAKRYKYCPMCGRNMEKEDK